MRSASRLTLNWSGAEWVSWKVLDAGRKTVLADRMNAPGSATADLPPVDYVPALATPGFAPIAVTLRAGQASVVTR
jgi:hypothetical protein